jgi:hypothetical protein
MARNRKHQAAAVRFGPALKALLICLLIGGSGVGYVWQQNQLLELGRQRIGKEKLLTALRAHNSQFVRQLAELQSPEALKLRVTGLKPPLVIVQPTQVVRLVDTVPSVANQTEPQNAREQTAALAAR